MFLLLFIPIGYVTIQWLIWILAKPAPTNMVSQKVSIDLLVVGRDEAVHLEGLFKQISEEIGCLNKVIYVDDRSSDESLLMARKLAISHADKVRIIELNSEDGVSPKKSGIMAGVGISDADWIWMLDGDVRLPGGCISRKQKVLERAKTMVVAGPIRERVNPRNFWSVLSWLEQAMMNTLYKGSILSGRPLLCSGANLAFRRKWFLQQQPFRENLNLFSGDDLAILEACGESVIFDADEEGMIETMGPDSAGTFFNQRIRRAGKLRYTGKRMNRIFGLSTIIAGVFALAILPVLITFGSHFQRLISAGVLSIYLGVMLTACLRGAGQGPSPGKFRILLTGFIYPAFAMLVPVLIFTRKTTWKGRNIQ